MNFSRLLIFNFIYFSLILFNGCTAEVYYIKPNDKALKYLNSSVSDIKTQLKIIYEREQKFSNDASHMYYGDMAKLINSFNLKRGAEIGVLYGGNIEYLLNNTKISKIYGIDPYDPIFFGNHLLAELMYVKTKKRIKKFKKRQKMVRKSSIEAAKLFSDNFFDFVFIDGDHTFEAVQQDLNAWDKKVKKGGLIIGDDYHALFPGVVKAVNDHCLKNNYKINFMGHENRIWWVQK